MRIRMAVPILVFVGAALGGCNTGAPQGVLPRDPVPPPPSLRGDTAPRQPAERRSAAPVQRQAIDVPDRIETPRPSTPAIQPVMTPGGAGAGFRF